MMGPWNCSETALSLVSHTGQGWDAHVHVGVLHNIHMFSLTWELWHCLRCSMVTPLDIRHDGGRLTVILRVKVIGKLQRSEQLPALMRNLAAMMKSLGTLKTWKQACFPHISSLCLPHLPSEAAFANTCPGNVEPACHKSPAEVLWHVCCVVVSGCCFAECGANSRMSWTFLQCTLYLGMIVNAAALCSGQGFGADGDEATTTAMKALRDEAKALRDEKAAKKAAFDAEYDVGEPRTRALLTFRQG